MQRRFSRTELGNSWWPPHTFTMGTNRARIYLVCYAWNASSFVRQKGKEVLLQKMTTWWAVGSLQQLSPKHFLHYAVDVHGAGPSALSEVFTSLKLVLLSLSKTHVSSHLFGRSVGGTQNLGRVQLLCVPAPGALSTCTSLGTCEHSGQSGGYQMYHWNN